MSPLELSGIVDNNLVDIWPYLGIVSSDYTDVDDKLQSMECYAPLQLAEFEPEERYKRRFWVDDLCVSSDIAFMKKSYGGKVGNINVIWKVDRADEDHDANMAKTVLLVNKSLPEYHTRQMKKDFIEKYQKVRKNEIHILSSE